MTILLTAWVKNKLWTAYTRRKQHLGNKRTRIDTQPNTKDWGHTGILYTDEPHRPEKDAAVLRFAETIQAQGGKVHVLCYRPNARQLEPRKFPTFTKEDIDCWGRSSQPAIKHFLQIPFVHLYYLDFTSEPIIDYLVASCHAKCKIANFMPGKMNLFEINFKDLDRTSGFDDLFNKMLMYTQQLQV